MYVSHAYLVMCVRGVDNTVQQSRLASVVVALFEPGGREAAVDTLEGLLTGLRQQGRKVGVVGVFLWGGFVFCMIH